jgi:hypothetical protein
MGNIRCRFFLSVLLTIDLLPCCPHWCNPVSVITQGAPTTPGERHDIIVEFGLDKPIRYSVISRSSVPMAARTAASQLLHERTHADPTPGRDTSGLGPGQAILRGVLKPSEAAAVEDERQ